MKAKTAVLNTFREIFKIPFLEKFLVRNVRGKSANSAFAKLVPNNYQYKTNTYRKLEYKGVALKVDISDYVGHYLYYGFDEPAQDRLIDMANESDVVLDIGTNIGSTLLQFANKVGDKGRVYGFEPDTLNYQRCKENINLNTFGNLSVANIGLGDTKGSFKLFVDTETNRGGNRIKYDETTGGNYTVIDVLTLDDWFKNQNIEKLDLVKIDVEGFEMNVLKGGEQVFNDFKPKMFIELDDNNLKDLDSSAAELIEFLEDKNYSIINADTNQKVTSNDDFKDCHYDIIATCKA